MRAKKKTGKAARFSGLSPNFLGLQCLRLWNGRVLNFYWLIWKRKVFCKPRWAMAFPPRPVTWNFQPRIALRLAFWKHLWLALTTLALVTTPFRVDIKLHRGSALDAFIKTGIGIVWGQRNDRIVEGDVNFANAIIIG